MPATNYLITDENNLYDPNQPTGQDDVLIRWQRETKVTGKNGKAAIVYPALSPNLISDSAVADALTETPMANSSPPARLDDNA
jgi:hypothetical protein